ncbi:ATP-dependent Clp protease proteolytic subunit, partial [Leptospira interrogans]
HQPMGGATGQASDIEIQAREVLKLKEILNSIYHKHTGKTVEQIQKDTERNFYMTADEAKNYGIIDTVIQIDRKQTE